MASGNSEEIRQINKEMRNGAAGGPRKKKKKRLRESNIALAKLITLHSELALKNKA